MPDKPTDRTTARLAWVRRVLDNPGITLEAASSDASFRSYWRLAHEGQSLIVMDAPPPQEDVHPWLDIGDRLAQAGVHVPSVHASDVEQGIVLIEDFGQRLYLPELADATADGLYDDALGALLRMQSRVACTDLPVYDAPFLRREMELLAPWFLERHLGQQLDAASGKVLNDAFDLLAANGVEQPSCFVHRDFHSRNLMITPHDNPGVIDFQGAVCGPITYDLVSLLRDCYIAWDETRVEHWMQGYRQKLIDHRLIEADVDAARFRRWFDLTGLQRHIKVLGLFCRLAYRDGKPGYLDDLPRVFDYVLDVASRYSELARLVELLRAAGSGRDLRQPAGDAACAH
ncbi:MAG TPA: phosphotransferase [Oleiagrimonas sp.]|nr:phosphotransferase [Oleiagrimonas sp.]